MADTGNIHLTIVDGRRQMLPPDTQVLIRLLNGAKKFDGWWAKGGEVDLKDIPLLDTGNDAYNVFASADGYSDAVTPNRVELKRNDTVEAHLMATPKHGSFHFQKWELFRNFDSRIVSLVTNGSDNPEKRYTDTYEAGGTQTQMGALLILATAIRDIPLVDKTTPLDGFYWQVMWNLLAPDRFWAWVDVGLADRIKELGDLHAFAPEADPAHWHPGIAGLVDPATRSWKQTRFDVANVQLTFHESTRTKLVDPSGKSVDCVVVEPDIDLFKDLVAHGLTEVVPNLLSGGKTDPRTVYAMRWMASKQEEGVPEFDPPVTIE